MFSKDIFSPVRLLRLFHVLAMMIFLSPGVLFSLGDIWVEVERLETSEKFVTCQYCRRQIKTGHIHKDAETIIKKRVQDYLIERGIGSKESKGPSPFVNILVYRFEERKGGNFAVEKPAGVGFHMHLMEGSVVGRVFVFDEDQQALSQNVLKIGKFFKRGGKWVTADQLAEEGINAGLDYLLEVME
jgi:hypothetical protein